MSMTPRDHIALYLRVYTALPEPSECRRRRVERGLSQAIVAEAVGVSPAAVGRWERGQRRPSRAVAARYLEALEALAA